MVSIPDWSKLGRLYNQNKGQPPPPHSKYFKQKEEEAIKQAEEQGYFIDVDKSYLKETYLGIKSSEDVRRSYFHEEKKPDFRKIKIIKLVGVHVRTISDIGVCTKLRICILNSNYIKDFQALAPCVHLTKLDLHNNQITLLPGAMFWSSMKSLRLLHLHNNPIGKIENLHHLASCPVLVALTLYDTPLSLKRNYRHHVVNTIWSLKALDKHVISDEEIIEDAEFGGKFRALHPNFAINLCPSIPEDSIYEEEKALVRHVLSRINVILAHQSPVLMVQRYVRGYLCRRKFKTEQDARIWAAVTIQRGFRDFRADGESAPPPPTSPTHQMPHDPSDIIDYDTYIKNRRPGSTSASEASLSSRMSKYSRKAPSEAKSKTKLTDYTVPEAPANSANERHSGDRRRKNLFINLSKLQNGTLASLQDEAIAIETIFPTENAYSSDDKTKSKSSRRIRKKRELRKKQIRSIKQFFGPIMSTSPVDEEPSPMPDQDEIPMAQFRLKGLKQTIKLVDPMTDIILSKKDAGQNIRAAENYHHQMAALMPKVKVKKHSFTSNDQRLFARVQGTMGLSCLNAVQQAYKDREKAERQVARLEFCLTMKDQREAAREHIRLYREERRNNTLREREQEQKHLLDTLEKQELRRLNYLDQGQELRSKTAQHLRQRKAELTFISDFNAQNTSVANALMRHDRQARQEDKLQNKSQYVQAHKDAESEQQEVVKKYLEHRQLMRQTESAMNRAALDSRMLQEANDRLMAAKARVAQQKARSAKVNNFYPLPSTAPACPVSLPPVTDGISSDEKPVERWNTSLAVTTESTQQQAVVAAN